MDKIKVFLSYSFSFGADVHISVQTILVVLFALILASYLLRFSRKWITRKLPENDKEKFVSGNAKPTRINCGNVQCIDLDTNKLVAL